MNTTKQFNDLPMLTKQLVLDEFASLICSIEFYDYRINLYALNNLYIERYQNIDTKEVERIQQATFGDLDKYMSWISFPSNLWKPNKKTDYI